jgi:hypothetical protein
MADLEPPRVDHMSWEMTRMLVTLCRQAGYSWEAAIAWTVALLRALQVRN